MDGRTDRRTRRLKVAQLSAVKVAVLCFHSVNSRKQCRLCRLWFGIPDIKVLVVKRKKKFLMKNANSANGLCQFFGVDA